MQLLKSLLLLLPFVVANPIPQEDRDIIPGQYIVTLKDGLTNTDIESHKAWVASVHRSNLAATGQSGIESEGIRNIFQIHNLNLYSGSFDAKTAEDIKRSPYVKSILPDRKVYLAQIIEQQTPLWNLGHMSSKGQQSRVYKYDSKAGEGVWAYVLDTGININHIEFEGRAILGYNAVKNVPHEDTFGHGSYVGGIICGKNYGVAKKANVVSAKAFDGGSSVLTRIVTPAGGKYQPFDDAIERAFQAGVLTVVASGNDGRDAAGNTPASAPNAITVGAIGESNTRPSFSNYGRFVDIFAPGDLIQSCWKGGNNATYLGSGTSAASPHVAGLAAYLMSMEQYSSPAAVTQKILQLSVPDVVKDPGAGSPNRLAYNGVQ
ncbi:serine-type peptidase [Emydomyces testavorans]|uniref:Serine-type peptidase n=1 Tax=Emydomyces testavorans TaxID=2070801 RepID=A0AAF0IG10_9EURO|nr:serine-type peptidase [Emydomyces testavorans]